VRTHLGVETQGQWSDFAILRTTPALLGLFSLVTVWADELARAPISAVRPRTAGWYDKREPTFSDTIAAVRRALWRPPSLSMSNWAQRPSKSLPSYCKGSQIPSATRPETRKVELRTRRFLSFTFLSTSRMGAPQAPTAYNNVGRSKRRRPSVATPSIISANRARFSSRISPIRCSILSGVR
jgi:hypothetical protein